MPLSLTKRRNQGQTFRDEEFVNMDLSSMLAFGSVWVDCSFRNCDFTLADFTNNTIKRCKFIESDLRLTNWRGSLIHGVTFEKCNLRQAVLAGVHPLEDVGFFDCQMHYSTFYDSTVKGCHFIGCNLHGADLRPIENTGWLFDDCVLWNASFQFGCQFLTGIFDERSVDLFLAMAARKHPNTTTRDRIREIIGSKPFDVLNRMMGEDVAYGRTDQDGETTITVPQKD